MTHLINLFTTTNDENFRAISKIGNELERTIAQSYTDMSLLQLTLANGKFYVGIATKIGAPGDLSYLTIFPLYSGYRDSESKELIFNTDYTSAYESYKDNDPTNDIIMNVVIKCDQIITATPFDIELYNKFNEEEKTTSD
ncbi:hypothetical protein GCM10009122_09930 [Fulvivirga kasyanovii]